MKNVTLSVEIYLSTKYNFFKGLRQIGREGLYDNVCDYIFDEVPKAKNVFYCADEKDASKIYFELSEYDGLKVLADICKCIREITADVEMFFGRYFVLDFDNTSTANIKQKVYDVFKEYIKDYDGMVLSDVIGFEHMEDYLDDNDMYYSDYFYNGDPFGKWFLNASDKERDNYVRDFAENCLDEVIPNELLDFYVYECDSIYNYVESEAKYDKERWDEMEDEENEEDDF